MKVIAKILEKGDIIRMMGVDYLVILVDETHVHYIPKSSQFRTIMNGRHTNTIGINSKQKIELVDPPKKPKLFIRPKGEYSNTTPFGIKTT